MVSNEWGGGSRHSLSRQAEPCGWGEPGKGEDRTGEEVAKEEEALAEAVLLVQEFLWPPPPLCLSLPPSPPPFAWTELPSRAAGAQKPGAVGRRQAGRGSCFHLDTKTHTGTRPYALCSFD